MRYGESSVNPTGPQSVMLHPKSTLRCARATKVTRVRSARSLHQLLNTIVGGAKTLEPRAQRWLSKHRGNRSSQHQASIQARPQRWSCFLLHLNLKTDSTMDKSTRHLRAPRFSSTASARSSTRRRTSGVDGLRRAAAGPREGRKRPTLKRRSRRGGRRRRPEGARRIGTTRDARPDGRGPGRLCSQRGKYVGRRVYSS